ncbi:MAG: transporter associated domain-containing protein [Legionellaceae bacterium]|nr:transporter associated domain-containing protein [Legionellaceae bacterium]
MKLWKAIHHWLQSFHKKPLQNPHQFLNYLRQGQEEGIIDQDTLSMIEGVLQLAQLRARDIMLPKTQMICIAHNTDFSEIIRQITEHEHSRYPVTTEGNEEVIGILHAKDLLRFYNTTDQNFDIEDVLRTPSIVPESKRIDILLREFRSSRNHMAIVIDEYGEISGFITIEDIIELITGDIEDEFDIDEDAYIKNHGNTRYIIKAQTPIRECNTILQTTFKDDLQDTIGGLITTHLGHVPVRGERVFLEGLEFKVLHADARRIKLLSCIDKRTQA